MNIIQFIISIHALHQYKLLDTIRNIFDRESDSDSESDQSSDSTGPPSLESSQVNFSDIAYHRGDSRI